MYTYIYDNSYSSTTAVLEFAYTDAGCSESGVKVYNVGGGSDNYFFTSPFNYSPGLAAPWGVWVTVAQN